MRIFVEFKDWNSIHNVWYSAQIFQFFPANKQTSIIQNTSVHVRCCFSLIEFYFFELLIKTSHKNLITFRLKIRHKEDVLTFDLSKYKKLQNEENPLKIEWGKGWENGKCFTYNPRKKHMEPFLILFLLRFEPSDFLCLLKGCSCFMVQFFYLSVYEFLS